MGEQEAKPTEARGFLVSTVDDEYLKHIFSTEISVIRNMT